MLQQVLDRRASLADALPKAQERVAEADRALVQELCYGTMRWLERLESVLAQLLERTPRRRDGDVRALLLLGLYQLTHLRVPAHAAIDETVEAARALGKSWACRLVNGVLRRFQRDPEGCLAAADAEPSARLAHPQWLLDALSADWPEDWEAIADANNRRPPMSVRVNPGYSDRDSYLGQLARTGHGARPLRHAPMGLVLEAPIEAPELPGFEQGGVTVQDGAAQLAVPLLGLEPGMRVLDACAAPGGKTAQILEQTRDLDLVAVDRDDKRLSRLRENLDRLGLDATLIAGDAADPAVWWDGRPFDRILLDAPCTATGVIRRHPDIKHLRRPDDPAGLARQQAALLDGCWRMLAPGGRVLYVTCSVLSAENSSVVESFLQRTPDAEVRAIEAGWGRARGPGRQVLPGEDDMDGFYFAVAQHVTAG